MKMPPTNSVIDAHTIAVASGQKPRLRYNANGSFTISGVDSPKDFFGPQQPFPPIAQDEAWGRQFDYPIGINTNIGPKRGEGITFDMLKNIADSYDVLRIIIEHVKELVVAEDWMIQPKDKDQKRDKRCDEMQKFFEMPDKEHSWDEWLKMLLEQVFVLDAPTVLTQRTRGGDVFAFQILDGATIQRYLTEDGRTPLPPDSAYAEVLKGLPAVHYTTDDITYKPRNLRAHKIYGFSVCEQIVTTVNISLHRQLYQLRYYTDGTHPDLMMTSPPGWSLPQCEEFQKYWEALLRGDLGQRRAGMMIPDGAKMFDTKEKALMDQMDEWLVRICCFAFSISPTPFIKQINRATAESHHQQSRQEGLVPTQQYVSRLINNLMLTRFGYADLTHAWKEDDAIDPLEQSEIYKNYLGVKVYHPDEVRIKLGEEPMAPELRQQLDEPDYSASPNAMVPDAEQAGSDQSTAIPQGGTTPQPGAPKTQGGGDGAKLGKSQAAPVARFDRSTRTVVRY